MKLSRTTKNYNKVFLSCGSFLLGQEPCGYFQWLHGPLWQPREQVQPSLRRWVNDNGKAPVPLLKKHCLDGPTPPPMRKKKPAKQKTCLTLMELARAFPNIAQQVCFHSKQWTFNSLMGQVPRSKQKVAQWL